jgi:hypothetical protein
VARLRPMAVVVTYVLFNNAQRKRDNGLAYVGRHSQRQKYQAKCCHRVSFLMAIEGGLHNVENLQVMAR